MSTVRDLITAALLDLGAIAAGEAPTAAEATDAFRRLNLMLEQWRLQRLLVYTMDTVTLTSTGASSYQWGPGGDITAPRPVRLEHGIQRVPGAGGSNNLDVPLVALNAVEYEGIALKDLSTWSYYFYLDGGFPSATLRFYPVMPAGYQALLYPWHPLLGFVTVDDPVAFPPGYELALQTNLSLHLVSMYKDCQINPLLGQQAQEGLHWLKMANMRPRHLTLPYPLTGRGSRHGTDRAAFLRGWA